MVTIATFCERALIDQDRMLTILRVADLVRIVVRPEEHATEDELRRLDEAFAGDERPAANHQMTFVMRIVSGASGGDIEFRLDFERPDGALTKGARQVRSSLKPHQAFHFVAPVQLQVQHEGMHWMRVVYLKADEEEILARVPVLVRYQRMPVPTSTSALEPEAGTTAKESLASEGVA